MSSQLFPPSFPQGQMHNNASNNEAATQESIFSQQSFGSLDPNCSNIHGLSHPAGNFMPNSADIYKFQSSLQNGAGNILK